MDKISISELAEDLHLAFVSLTDVAESKAFLSDLLTGNELEQFAQRLRAARLLLEGHTYSQIIEQTDISSATLSRVSNCVRRGSGGYANVLKKIDGEIKKLN